MSNITGYFDAKEVSRRIREIRIRLFGRRGLSRFARALGLAPSTYIEYEKGRIPPEKTLRKIAQQGNVSVAWLLGEPKTGLPAPIQSGLVRDKNIIPPQELKVRASEFKQFQILKELLKQKTGREIIKAVLQSLSADEPTRRKINALLRQL